jgi:transposase
MYLRPCHRTKNGKRHAYWALVESYRTSRGPRQRVVAYLGDLDEQGRLGVHEAATGHRVNRQGDLFQDQVEPRWVEVDVRGVRVERVRDFGGAWLGLELVKQLDLPSFLNKHIPPGREQVPWPLMSLVLVLGRLCDPSSELRIAEHLYPHSALADLLGVAADRVNDDRLYRALDQLLPHKSALESHLKERLGELFDLDYDLILYDVTSTYFEGQAKGNPLAQRGYSRDHRPDCKQVCIGLVVSRCGMPLGYEVLAGNRHDSTTVQQIVATMEERYGRAHRIWVMDRGMVSPENLDYLRQDGRRYIVGTPKSMLKDYEQALRHGDWQSVHEGLEVQRVPGPSGDETFILCRSAARREKEKAMHERFDKRIEEGLTKLAGRLEGARKMPDRSKVERQIGRLLERNSRAAGLFEIHVRDVERQGRKGLAVTWTRRTQWRDWAMLSEGCYLLRTNVQDWSAQDLWQAYIQLTEAEAAFRIHKSDLRIRPIWHQKEDRVQAHILVCFLAYVLWKTLAGMCQRAGLGDEPRRVFDELSRIRLVDVILPTRCGITLRQRCVSRPTDHQAILLHRLGLHLPQRLEITECSEDF